MGKLEEQMDKERQREIMLNILAARHGGIPVSEMVGCTWDS